MLNLLGFEDLFVIVPFLFIPLVFGVIVVVVIVTLVKRYKIEQRQRENNGAQTYPFADGNGRTERQRDYLAAKRRELSERKAASADSHSHSGRREAYEPIVGSLGEVNDEGCDELDGVRLIEHDEA